MGQLLIDENAANKITALQMSTGWLATAMQLRATICSGDADRSHRLTELRKPGVGGFL